VISNGILKSALMIKVGNKSIVIIGLLESLFIFLLCTDFFFDNRLDKEGMMGSSERTLIITNIIFLKF
jgi:hypothetical protein